MKKKGKSIKRRIGRAGIYLGVILLLLWTFAPLLWMFYSSICEKSELLTSGPVVWPEKVTFYRYREFFSSIIKVFRGGRIASTSEVFIHSIFNSFKVAAVTTGISLLIGGMAAYAFARLKFRGSNVLMILALFIQLLPTVSLVIPLYETVSRLGMIDRISTLVVLYLGMVMAYAIWVLHGYFKSIPPDLEDAARIDGCSYFQAFLRVIVPLAKPGYVAVGTLVFLMCWDEFLYALIFMNSKKTTTLTVALSQFSTTHGGIDYGMLMAGGCIATLIPMLLAIFFQKYIVLGLTAGGVKD